MTAVKEHACRRSRDALAARRGSNWWNVRLRKKFVDDRGRSLIAARQQGWSRGIRRWRASIMRSTRTTSLNVERSNFFGFGDSLDPRTAIKLLSYLHARPRWPRLLKDRGDPRLIKYLPTDKTGSPSDLLQHRRFWRHPLRDRFNLNRSSAKRRLSQDT